MTYFNTTKLKGESLLMSQRKAETQEQIIYGLFLKHQRFSASQIYRRQFAGRCPITSVRRALTVLKNYELIRETGEYTEGIYGKPEIVWEIIDNQLKLF